eukprot:gene10126-8967_t
MEEPQNLDELAADIAGCERLLIVAAAGLSISTDLPNNPYHSHNDFALHYPKLLPYGYRTAFDAMTVGQDTRVPQAVRTAHLARHFLNMRFNFPPTPGYTHLRRLADRLPREDVFCWTSNVDGCFERAGFDPSQVYQTQGEMNRLQCVDCGNVWLCESQLRAIAAASPDGALTDMDLAPSCPKCGSRTFLPNLRGGDWFIHKPYEATQQRLIDWLDACVDGR